jgi:hypothetical protein
MVLFNGMRVFLPIAALLATLPAAIAQVQSDTLPPNT